MMSFYLCYVRFRSVIMILFTIRFAAYVGQVTELRLSFTVSWPDPYVYASVWFSENYGRNYSQYINNVKFVTSWQWCHNECDGISDHWYLYCLLDHLFRRRSKKSSELHDTDLFEGNSLVTSEFSAQWGSNAENVSIWWRHHVWSSLHEKLSWPLVRSDILFYSRTCGVKFTYTTQLDNIQYRAEAPIAISQSSQAFQMYLHNWWLVPYH